MPISIKKTEKDELSAQRLFAHGIHTKIALATDARKKEMSLRKREETIQKIREQRVYTTYNVTVKPQNI